MTDMEEQRMIEQAKSGDPKAQFELSQWARQMSILEPHEERWNRLAAKCLVDSAKAGYGPAKEMVERLVAGETEPAAVPAEEEEDDWSAAPASVQYDRTETEEIEPEEDGERPGASAVLEKIGAGLKAFWAFVLSLIAGISNRGGDREEDEDYEEEEEEELQLRRAGRHQSTGGISGWVEENWGVLRIVCIAVCVVLVILAAVLLFPSKEAEPEPTPTVAPTAEPTPEPTQEPFPNEATVLEITGDATLLYRPGDSDASDYLPASTAFTVTAENYENLRQGPSAGDYPEVIMTIDQGETVTAYAKYTNDEGTVWYLINYGGTWGWMYGQSLG